MELGQNSSFMYQGKERVRTGFAQAFQGRSLQLGAWKDGTLKGYIQVVDEDGYTPGDVLGPFVPDGDTDCARGLLERAMAACPHIDVFKFNFVPGCFLYDLFRPRACKEEINFVLKLPSRAPRMDLPPRKDCLVQPHQECYGPAVTSLFDQVFPDAYLTASDIVQNHEGSGVLLNLVQGKTFLGFCYCRPQDGYLDILAIEPAWQGKGFGRYLLSRAIDLIQQDNPVTDIRLNVDLASRAALSLYTSLGFEIVEEYVSFHLRNPHHLS